MDQNSSYRTSFAKDEVVWAVPTYGLKTVAIGRGIIVTGVNGPYPPFTQSPKCRTAARQSRRSLMAQHLGKQERLPVRGAQPSAPRVLFCPDADQYQPESRARLNDTDQAPPGRIPYFGA